MSGAWFKTKDTHELGINDTSLCQLCGEEEIDITHILWDCKKIHDSRNCFKLRELKREDIPRNMKLGAPNAMNKRIDALSVGQLRQEIDTTNDEMLELMGMSTTRKQKQRAKDTNEMANRVYTKFGMNSDGMNARQAFLKCKKGTPSFQIPKVKIRS